MYAQKSHFFVSALLTLLFWYSSTQYKITKAEDRDKSEQLLVQSVAEKPRFKNYWNRFKIYPERLRPNRALVIADGGYLEFEDRIKCPSGVEVWIHTPVEPQVVLDVVKTTRVSIESTNFTRSLVVVVADENFNILSCDKGALPGAQINTLTLRTGTYGIWYGVRVGYRPSRLLHSKLWIINE